MSHHSSSYRILQYNFLGYMDNRKHKNSLAKKSVYILSNFRLQNVKSNSSHTWFGSQDVRIHRQMLQCNSHCHIHSCIRCNSILHRLGSCSHRMRLCSYRILLSVGRLRPTSFQSQLPRLRPLHPGQCP
mgnify:CR=1 FL=1